MKAYTNDSSDSQLLIEKFVKTHKAHRSILDQETILFYQWSVFEYLFVSVVYSIILRSILRQHWTVFEPR